MTTSSSQKRDFFIIQMLGLSILKFSVRSSASIIPASTCRWTIILQKATGFLQFCHTDSKQNLRNIAIAPMTETTNTKKSVKKLSTQYSRPFGPLFLNQVSQLTICKASPIIAKRATRRFKSCQWRQYLLYFSMSLRRIVSSVLSVNYFSRMAQSFGSIYIDIFIDLSFSVLFLFLKFFIEAPRAISRRLVTLFPQPQNDCKARRLSSHLKYVPLTTFLFYFCVFS